MHFTSPAYIQVHLKRRDFIMEANVMNPDHSVCFHIVYNIVYLKTLADKCDQPT